MAKRIIGKGTIVSVRQDEYDDGIQELYIDLDDGTRIHQVREWPDLVYRGDDRGDSAHGPYLDHLLDIEPNALYAYINASTKLIEGPELKPDRSEEVTVSEE